MVNTRRVMQVFLVGYLLFTATTVRADDIDSAQKALKIISEFANSICHAVPLDV